MKPILNCLIIDDEPLAADLLASYIQRLDYLRLAQRLYNPVEALAYLKTHQVDLVFADINMPVLSGMDLARSLHPNQKVIFTTAYSSYAVESYSVSTIDYLLKPVTFERFVQATDKAMHALRPVLELSKTDANEATTSPHETVFFVKSGKSMVRINFNDLFYIEGLKDYVIFHLQSEKHIVYKRMKDLEIMLPKNFTRVQHSFIVNTDLITKIEDNHVYIHNQHIGIGSKYREAFLRQIKARTL